MEPTRQTLIQKICNQYDDEAWEDFVSLYKSYIYIVIRKMNIPHDQVADLLQDILLKLWNRLPEFKYEPKKSKFRTWLNRITKNHVLNFIRNESNRQNKHDQAGLNMPKVSENEIDKIMTSEWQNFIANKAMEHVKKAFSGKAIEVFERSLKGEDISQISLVLEIEESSVYKLRSRVKETLKQEIMQLKHDLE